VRAVRTYLQITRLFLDGRKPREMPNVWGTSYVSASWRLRGLTPEESQFHTSLPTHCVLQNISSKADKHSTAQKQSPPLRNANVHYRVHNSLTLNPIMKPVQISISYVNIFVPSTPGLLTTVLHASRHIPVHLVTTEYEVLVIQFGLHHHSVSSVLSGPNILPST
jgi:hypothetical protein